MIYNKYVTRSLVRLFFVTLCITAFLLWLTKSLKFLELITTNGISMMGFLKVATLLLIPICFVMIPIALSISVVMTFYILIQNKEIIVLRASGFSNVQILKPAIKFAAIVMIFEYLISFYLLPMSYKEFKLLQREYKDQIIGMFIEEGIFNSQINDITVYVEKKLTETHYKGIFIYNNQNSEKPATIIADSGYLLVQEIPEFVLYNGVHQELNNKNHTLSMVKFSSYNVKLENMAEDSSGRVADSNEYNIVDLLQFRNFTQRSDRLHFVNANHRIVWPLFCLAITIFCGAFMLRGNLGRKVSNKNAIFAIFIAGGFLMIDLMLNNSCAKNIMLIPLMYLNLIVALVIGFVMMAHKRFVHR